MVNLLYGKYKRMLYLLVSYRQDKAYAQYPCRAGNSFSLIFSIITKHVPQREIVTTKKKLSVNKLVYIYVMILAI